MAGAKVEINFAINTIEDMYFNNNVYTFFDLLEKLINDGHELTFYRVGNEEPYVTIKDLNHLKNFIKSFKVFKV